MSGRFVLRSFFVPFLVVLTLLVGAVPTFAQATTESERFTEPFEFDSINPCTGESVHLTGEIRITLRTTFDANGGYHSNYTLVPSGVRGVGESGARYKAVGGEREHFNITAGGAVNQTYTSTFNLISQGGGQNFRESVTIHATVNANGELTTDIFHSRSECGG